MRPEEARKLLGGYATGTLTEAEEQALFAAALEDQALFDELAREQGLRDLLRDPAAKGALLAALDGPRRAWWRSWKPAAVLAMAGVAAVAVVVGTRKAPAPVDLVAKVEMPVAPPAAALVVSPSTAVPESREPPKPAARRKFQPPAAPAPAPKPAVELAEAPRADALKVEAAAAPVAVAGAVAAPPTPPVQAQDAAVTPMFERTSETRVQSFAQMRQMRLEQQLSARAMFQAGSGSTLRVQAVASTSGAAAQALGLRYSIVREGGNVSIRATSNVNAYLSVGGAPPVSLTAMQPYTTPPLAGDEVKVVLARQPETSVTRPVVPVTEVSGGETYVVSPTGAALSLTIPLKQP